MAIIRRSNKLDSEQPQSKVFAGGFVLLRVLRSPEDTYTVMTATADEDDCSHAAFPDQRSLMEFAVAAFRPISNKAAVKTDHKNRLYVEFPTVEDPKALQDAANQLAGALGLDPATIEWTDAEAREEIKAIWSEFSVDDEDDAYLSDGVHASKSGRLSGLSS